MYCNNSCQGENTRKILTEKWLLGLECGWSGKTRAIKKFVRAYLFEKRGTSCSICGWDEKHPCDGSTLTEIDHIDGNAENCRPENLRILCPNCHAMTPNFRSRNKKSCRQR